jgi:aminoglycoside phosphotransferase (APT) family kinase protein
VSDPREVEARRLLARFGVAAPVSIIPVGGGHINLSWKIVPRSAFRVAAHPTRHAEPGTRNLLLQRLNPAVFPDGALVLRNVALVTAHLARSARRLKLPDPARCALRVIPAPGGEPGLAGEDGAWWRLVEFIDGTRSLERADSPAVAREAGRAFGRFHRMLADYEGPPLAETIPGFHDTAGRLARLEGAAARDRAGRLGQVGGELALARSRAAHAALLPPLLASGTLPGRVVHNDAKLENVLLDARTGQALAVVDLDTVMPGTLLYDVGDLIRSLASATDEDERDPGRITLRPEMIAALAGGFLEAGGALAAAERELFVFAGILLAYEQGVRFLTDYLEGDVYYRIVRPGQNLDRCRAQFRLMECLEAGRGALERQVRGEW